MILDNNPLTDRTSKRYAMEADDWICTYKYLYKPTTRCILAYAIEGILQIEDKLNTKRTKSSR